MGDDTGPDEESSVPADLPPDPMLDTSATTGSLPQVDPFVGRTIDDRYRIVGWLGRGAMGVVYRAEQARLGREVAVKLLDPVDDGRYRPDMPESNFMKEASVLGTLEHPHSVRIFDFGEWEGRTYVVMELLRGRTLEELLVAGAMRPERVIHIVRQVVGALREAHSLEVVHRDLKPGNVILSPRPGDVDFVKVIDYGLARKTDQRTNALMDTDLTMGTPGYMAPETVRGTEQDARVDIYAVGVLLYELLTGKPPFPRDVEIQELLLDHLHSKPPPFTKRNPDVRVPECLEWTTMVCLRKDPEERFRTVGELDRALQACQVAVDVPDLKVELDLKDGMVVLPAFLKDRGTGSVRIAGSGLDSTGAFGAALEPPPRRPWLLPLLLLIALLFAAVMFLQLRQQSDRSLGGTAPDPAGPPPSGTPEASDPAPPVAPAAQPTAPSPGAASESPTDEPVGEPEQESVRQDDAPVIEPPPEPRKRGTQESKAPARAPAPAAPAPTPTTPTISSPATPIAPAPEPQGEGAGEEPASPPSEAIEVRRSDLKNPFGDVEETEE